MTRPFAIPPFTPHPRWLALSPLHGCVFSVAAAVGGLIGALGGNACQGSYPLAPTDCDDWCLATLRADCSDDFPDDCVGTCESRAPGRRFPECEDVWLAVSSCYLRAPGREFSCVNTRSRPASICLNERLRQAECVSDSARACVQYCFYQAEQCQGNAADCEQNCFDRDEVCPAEAQLLHECALQAPVSCGLVEADAGMGLDLACLQELDAFLRCAESNSEGPMPSE